ncbi:MAG: acyl-CoA dehydrogenase family protein [Thermoflexales bacterium]|nr:acyl-CoA dehydrogenase family protein [Thermoflexales bacterium]
MDLQLSEEQAMFRRMVHEFAERELAPRARHTDEAAEFNWTAVNKMGPLGLLGLNVPEEYGGPGIDPVSAAIAIEEIGWGCGSTGLAIAAHNGLGCAPIVLFGSEEQKRRWLPPLASGQGKLGALALTEPGAGSDLAGGVRVSARRDGPVWVLNGEKMWCTNASVADVIITLCRTGPADGSASGSRSLSLIIVPAGAPGLTIGPAEKKMGLKGSLTHALVYDEVRVPAENLLGEEGRGLHQALQALDGGRIGIGALSVGLAQAAYEEALRYAKERCAFGVPIAQHQAIQAKLADSATAIEAARLLVYRAAWLKQQGRLFTKEAAMAKLFASETAEKVCFEAVQIHGGYGYSSEFPVERIYRDQRLMSIGEGTNEILRLVIARHLLRDLK